MVSVASCFITVWTVTAVAVSVLRGHSILATVVATLAFVTAWLYSMPSRSMVLVVPLLFLCERLHADTFAVGHSPLTLYGSSMFAWLFLRSSQQALGASNSGKPVSTSAKPPTPTPTPAQQWQSMVIENVSHVVAVSGILFYLTRNVQLTLGFAGFVGTASLVSFLLPSTVFAPLECYFVASFAGFLVCDLATNNELSSADDNVRTVTTRQHMVGRAAFLGALALCVTMVGVNRLLRWLDARGDARRGGGGGPRGSDTGRRTALFLFVAMFHIGAQIELCRWLMRSDPLAWLGNYVTGNGQYLGILGAWAIGIPAATVVISRLTTRMNPVLRRKLFHLLAFLAFSPVAVAHERYMALALAAAVSICVMVECSRCFGIAGASGVTRFLAPFLDDRDKAVVRTHAYLMFGCGLSLWMHTRHAYVVRKMPDRLVDVATIVVPGILALGVTDAMAAVVGTLVGGVKWISLLRPLRVFTVKDNAGSARKTLSGTVGAFVSSLVAWYVLAALAEAAPIDALLRDKRVPVAIALTSFIEAFLPGIDNLELPFVSVGVLHFVCCLAKL